MPRASLEDFECWLRATSGPRGIVGTPEWLAKQEEDRKDLAAFRESRDRARAARHAPGGARNGATRDPSPGRS